MTHFSSKNVWIVIKLGIMEPRYFFYSWPSSPGSSLESWKFGWWVYYKCSSDSENLLGWSFWWKHCKVILITQRKNVSIRTQERSFPWLIPHKYLLNHWWLWPGLRITSHYLKIFLGNLEVFYSCGRLLLLYGTLEELFSTFHAQWGFGGSFKKIVFQLLGGPVMKPRSTLHWSIRVKALLAEIWFRRSQRVFHKKSPTWLVCYEVAELNAFTCSLSKLFSCFSMQDNYLNKSAFIFFVLFNFFYLFGLLFCILCIFLVQVFNVGLHVSL